MKGILKCITFARFSVVSLFVLSLLSFSLIFSTESANALTRVDDLYKSTETISVKYTGSQPCDLPDVDVSINWSQYLTDENLWYPEHVNGSYYTTLQTMKSSWENAQRWAVTQNGNFIIIVWTEDTSLALDWHISPYGQEYDQIFVGSTGTVHVAYLQSSCDSFNGTGANAQVMPNAYSSYNNAPQLMTISDRTQNFKNYLVYTDYYNYPTDYEGPEVPSTAGPKEMKIPNVDVFVNDKEVTITSRIDPEVKGGASMHIKSILIEDRDGEIFLDSAYHMSPNSSKITVDEYSDYNLTVSYVETSQSGGIYNDLPDDDYFAYETYLLSLDIDGSTYSYVSETATCDEFGLCTDVIPPEWVAETCSITELGGCIRNVIHYIEDWLGISKTSTNPTGSAFLSFQTETHGLTSVITAPLYIFSNISEAQYTCNEVILPLPYLTNKQITLPCMQTFYQTTFGLLFTMYQTIVGGIISYYVIVKLLETAKNAKDPKHDRIEVAKL